MNNTRLWTTMKPWHAIIAMVGILTLVCAPVVANMVPEDWVVIYDDSPSPDGRKVVIYWGPEPGFGTLSINSDPSGANVYHDGQYKGTTPLTISGLPSQHSYNLVLTMQGYRPYVTSVSISNGKTSTVSATLTPILPSSYVSSKPKIPIPTPSPPARLGWSAWIYYYLQTRGNLPVI
jgi:hypothetical protein